MKWKIEFKPQDCWIGAYFKRKDAVQHVWICIVPMIPLHIWWRVRVEQGSLGVQSSGDRHAGGQIRPVQ